MTPRERMLTAFRAQEPDHFPIHVRGVRAWDDEWCESRHASYQPIIEAVREWGAYETGISLGGGHVLSAHPVETSVEEEDAGDWIIRRVTPASARE